MRLYGSFTNRVMESPGQPKPEVGMGATICSYTDRHAATVVEVSPSGKRITVQEDIATRTDSNGMSECQSYSYAPNPEAERQVFTLRKDGRWVLKGGRKGLALGTRRHYHDYSF